METEALQDLSGDRKALAWGIPTSWVCAVWQEKPRAEGRYAVTKRLREAKEKGRKEGNCVWKRGSCKGCGELMKTGKKSTGKSEFSPAAEQILPQKLTAAEEIKALKGLLHALTPKAIMLFVQNWCCFVQRRWFWTILISWCLSFIGANWIQVLNSVVLTAKREDRDTKTLCFNLQAIKLHSSSTEGRQQNPIQLLWCVF